MNVFSDPTGDWFYAQISITGVCVCVCVCVYIYLNTEKVPSLSHRPARESPVFQVVLISLSMQGLKTHQQCPLYLFGLNYANLIIILYLKYCHTAFYLMKGILVWFMYSIK